jgi:hypothetical protein
VLDPQRPLTGFRRTALGLDHGGVDAPRDLRTPLPGDAPCIFQPHRILAIDADGAPGGGPANLAYKMKVIFPALPRRAGRHPWCR